ncbi:glycerophosphodiester phosphodiesterase [Salinirussus salinus]|uniref:glycerophosphodiester phosphodiesterase n=1 Tax=Salinirussus salinus TaxID=1198300 RepID=UPI00135A75E6|nr:glycerophosphodiester phosphodiesterase family protein [Salinirussus salinus]
MDCIAHRGFAETNPENTLVAVRAAGGTGPGAAGPADAVEVDVRRCGSGELVVIHDGTVDRVSDGTGRVADLTLPELRGLDVLDTGAGVPTLAEVSEATAAPLNVELKERGLAADALELADQAGVDAWYSAFDPAAAEEVREHGGEAALLFAEDPDGALDRARRLDCVAVHPHHSLCDADFVRRAREAGLDVNAWTVRSREVATALAGAGADGLIADAPGYCPDR